MSVNVFLDLEETVIDAWGKMPIFLKHCDVIEQTLTRLNPDRVFIFSFAIHTPEEEEEFRIYIQSDLETKIGRKIMKVIPVRDMFLNTQRVHKMHFLDGTDFLLNRGKEGAFIDWCVVHHLHEINFLIDDVVPNRTTIDHDTNTEIITINVESLGLRRW